MYELETILKRIPITIGLFSTGHLDYFIESANSNDPTLEEMTRTAITMLQKEVNGYVLLVEGTRFLTVYLVSYVIDLCNH